MPANHYTLTPEQGLVMADQLLHVGQKQQAVNILLECLQHSPGHAQLSLKLARLLHQHGHNAEAVKILKKAHSASNSDLELSYMLAALLHVEGHFSQAKDNIKACIADHPESAQAYNLLGSTLIEQNQYDAAIDAFVQSIQLNPDSADAYNNLAWALRALGRKDEAIKHFEKAFAVDEQATEALSGLLLLKTYTEKSPEFTKVESLINSGQLNIKQSTELQFALGKAYEDIKDYPSAFRHFQQANKRWRKSLNYSIQSDQALFDALKKLFNKDSLAQFSKASATSQQGEAARLQPQPIFVVGMPRSSTTLIEQILSSHSAIVGGGELPFLEQLLLTPDRSIKWSNSLSETDRQGLAQRYLGQMQQHQALNIEETTRYVTDKLPQNFRFIGAILSLFPDAKIIHCKRHPMDTCLSLFKHHFPMAKHHYAYDLKELGQYYNLYEDLMQHWHSIAPGTIFDIQYEDLLENFEPEDSKLLAFCGLDFEAGCLAFEQNKRVVRTASSDQVRQGLFKQGAGRWQHYAQQLMPLKASLRSYS